MGEGRPKRARKGSAVSGLPNDIVSVEEIKSVCILEFARSIGGKLVAIERGPSDLEFCERMWGQGHRYLAHFVDCDVKDGIMLGSAFGNGDTPEDAIADYCKRIRRRILVFHAFDKRRRKEILAPEKLHLEPSHA